MVHQQVEKHLPKSITYDTFVALEKNKVQKVELYESKNITVSYCFNKYDKINFKRKNHKIYRALSKKIDNSYDLIHAHSLFTNGVSARRFGKKHEIPYVVTVRSTDLVTFFKKMVHLRKMGIEVLLDAEKIILLSSKSFETLKRYIPRKYIPKIENKIEIVPNGINNFWFENANNESKRIQKDIQLLHVGDISRRKNILQTVRVLEYLNDMSKSHFTLNVVGRVRSKRIFKKIKNKEDINYYGLISKEDLIDIYRRNDILIVPSIKETFGLVYPEAMSQGLPVIYTKNEGFDGQFEDGVVGYAVIPKDTKDISDKILKIIEHYEELSSNALKLYAKFDWTLITKEIVKIYEEVGGQIV